MNAFESPIMQGSSSATVMSRQDQLSVDVGALTLLIDEPVGPARATVICLHGWTLDSRSFEAQRGLAKRGFRWVRFDRRGFGASDLSPDFDQELSDLSAVIDVFEGDIYLYGVSQGGRLALRYMVENGDRLAGAILQGSHVEGLPVDEQPGEGIPLDEYTQLIASGQITAFREAWLNHPLVSGGATPEQRDGLAVLLDRYTGQDLMAPNSRGKSVPVWPSLSEWEKPLLVISGSAEVASRREHASVLSALPSCREVIIEGGGHLCNVTHAEAVNDALLEWLEALA